MTVNAKPVTRRKAQKKHRLHKCPEWHEIKREIPEAFRKWEQKARNSKEEWKRQRGIVTHPISESQWNRNFSSMKSGSLKRTRVGAYQPKVSRATLQQTALFWEQLGSGEHVVQFD